MRPIVTVFTRTGCHLCEVAEETLIELQKELDFAIEKRFIDGDAVLEAKYGEKIPVILIEGKHHDFYRVNPDRFRVSLERHRQRQ